MSNVRFCSALNPDLVIEIKGGVYQAGSILQLGKRIVSANSESINHQWWFENLGNKALGAAEHSGLVLDVKDEKIAPGATVQLANRDNPTTPNQQWVWREAVGSFGYISNRTLPLVVEIPNSSKQPGTQVRTYGRNKPLTMNQLWQLKTENGHYYYASALDPNLVLDVRGSSNTAGTPVQTYTKNTPITPNQTWSTLFSPSGQFYSGLGDRLVLDAPSHNGDEVKSGVPLQIYPLNEPKTVNQYWSYYSSFFYIYPSSNPNVVLSPKGGLVQEGSPIQLSIKSTPVQANQLWSLEFNNEIS